MEIIGHQKQWQFLKKSAESQKISHAYLFSGQEKLGKKKVALEFIKLINGAESLKSPDLILIEPEKKEIKIFQIRELIQKLSLKPYSALFKIAIIDKADLMTNQAQSALLKTLEEPKSKTLLILISEKPDMLFLTIRSRCEIIKFFPVRETEIKKYLREKGLSEETSNFCLGKPGEAIDFISNPQKLEEKKRIIKNLIKLSSSELVFRFQCAKDLSNQLDLKEVLEVWLLYFRNTLLTRVIAKDKNEDLVSSFTRLKNIINQIQKTIFLLTTTNINPRLALEVLMLEL